jgi:phenylacetate-CoA ligase
MFADRTSLELHQSHRLRELLAAILPGNKFYHSKFASSHMAARDVQSLADLASIPFTTKSELTADQQRYPPCGSALTFPISQYARLHQTSGTTTGKPLRWLDTMESWDWMLSVWDQIFAWIGLRSGDRLFFPFSFGPFLGFWTAFEAAARGGWFVLPGGGMSSAARLNFLVDHRITVVFCTPTYALHLAEVAAQQQVSLAASDVRMLVVAGEPGGNIASTRERIESAWGARVIDHSGLTEVGPVAVECWDGPGSLQLLEGDYIAEVVNPKTGTATDTIGELVLTNLGRIGSPILRYRTGDLVQWDATSDCVYRRLKGGILGRVDDMIQLRGNNVYPSAIEAVVRRFAEVAEFRLVVTQEGALSGLRIEVEPMPEADGAILIDRVGSAIRNDLLFRADVVSVPPGSLPRFELKAQRLVREA